MRIEYSKRSLDDLRKVSAESKATYGTLVAAAVEARILKIVSQISESPESAPPVEGRPGVHTVPLVRFPYRLFYRIRGQTIRILHIRHTSRRQWKPAQ